MNAVAERPHQNLTLRYPVVVTSISKAEGGGFAASIPQLGEKTFVATAENRDDALNALEELCDILEPELATLGITLPAPAQKEADGGHLHASIPPSLHRRLREEARREGCSLDELVTRYLSEGAVVKVRNAP
jgi:antitoxin HicB